MPILRMIIMRGAPGSGKSHLAKQLLEEALVKGQGEQGVILSTDDYFMTPEGYVHDITKLRTAHEWNLSRALEACQQRVSPVIVDNTNIKNWEMVPYMDVARKFNYTLEVVEPQTAWWLSRDVDEMARLNSHSVPREVIQRMVDSFETLKPTSARLNAVQR